MLRILIVLLTLALQGGRARSEVYDPLNLADAQALSFDETIHDTARNREIPVRIYYSNTAEKRPVLLWSHGLGGSREGSAYLGEHWAKRGYIVVSVQHPGSDESVWQGVGRLRALAALKAAANRENFEARCGDVSVTIDQLAMWNDGVATGEHDKDVAARLRGKLDLNRVGMSGHSFGAVTTQAVAGQTFLGGGANLREPRIKAAILMSPSSPRVGTARAAFGEVSEPWLLLTGTNDEGRIGGQTPASRREVYPALPPGDKYQLVLDGAEHSAFGDRQLPGEGAKRNPNHHRAVLATTTAFLDAYLRDDEAAQNWLQGGDVRGVLEPADVWESK
ncbi:MAG: dienelactone hydrolase [Planctomycetales bacterium]|nr:dienelactone hydrolase [Planctomycetales bacterium]